MSSSMPPSKFYKPLALRAPSFAFFCIITIILFTLLLIASQTHFSSSDGSSSDEPKNPGIYINGTYFIPPTAPPSSAFSNFSKWSSAQYFTGAYLPTLLAVLYSAYWDIIFMRLKEMEPFYRLSQTGGVRVKESLLLEYKGGSLPGVLVQAYRNRHAEIVVACIVSVVLTISVPFASEVLYIGTSGTCTSNGDGNQCNPYLAVRTGVARFEQVVMGAVFLMAAWSALRWRNSGVYSEPTSIAGLAMLLQDSEIVKIMQDASRIKGVSELEQFLEEKKYAIRKIGGREGQRSVLFAIHQQSSDRIPEVREKGNIVVSHAMVHESPQDSTESKPSQYTVLNPIAVLLFLFTLAGLVVLIIYYRLVGTPSGFESFMDSQSMGVRFLMTSVGVLIKIYWTSLERVTRTREPYRLLAAGNAQPKDTILDPSRSHALTALFTNLFRHRLFLAYIALNTALSEVLTVALSGVPFHSSSSRMGYVVSTWLSVAIFFSMMIGLVLAFFRESRSGGANVPGHLGRILTPLMILCHSEEILRDMSELGGLDTEMRNERVEAMGRRYKFGRVADLDGGLGYGIEYDVLQDGD